MENQKIYIMKNLILCFLKRNSFWNNLKAAKTLEFDFKKCYYE